MKKPALCYPAVISAVNFKCPYIAVLKQKSLKNYPVAPDVDICKSPENNTADLFGNNNYWIALRTAEADIRLEVVIYAV